MNHDGNRLSRFWTLCPILLRSRPKAHLCVRRKALGSVFFGLGGSMALWRRTTLGGMWRVTERGSRVTVQSDDRLVLCLWPSACSCERHCGQTYLHTFGSNSRRHHRPRGAALFKMEAKGQAHTVYANTQCMLTRTLALSPVQQSPEWRKKSSENMNIQIQSCKKVSCSLVFVVDVTFGCPETEGVSCVALLACSRGVCPTLTRDRFIGSDEC